MGLFNDTSALVVGTTLVVATGLAAVFLYHSTNATAMEFEEEDFVECRSKRNLFPIIHSLLSVKFIHACTYMYIYMCVCVCMYVYVCMHACMYIYVCMYVCMYVTHICACLSMCMFVHKVPI
jgi:hypothetical protein